MLRIILFAAVVFTSLCQSAEAQLNVFDEFYDFRIEVRRKSSIGEAIYFDTHQPTMGFGQVNRSWKAFPSTEKATTFMASHPRYELLDSHRCTIEASEWYEVDTAKTMDEAVNRRLEIRLKSNSQLDVAILPYYSPPAMGTNPNLSIKNQPSLPEPKFRP